MSKAFTIVVISVAIVLSCALSFLAGWELSPRLPAPTAAITRAPASTQVTLGGKVLDIPPGYEAVIESEQEDGTYKVVNQTKNWGAVTGDSYTQSGGDVKADVRAGKNVLNLPGAYAESGGFAANITANGGMNVTAILAGLGVLCLIGGCVLFFMGWRGIGLGLIVGGAVCVVAAFVFETAPWLVYIIALIGLGVLAYVIYRSWKTKQLQQTEADKTTALKAITQGIENAPRDLYDAVTKLIGKSADLGGVQDKATVKTVVTESLTSA